MQELHAKVKATPLALTFEPSSEHLGMLQEVRQEIRQALAPPSMIEQLKGSDKPSPGELSRLRQRERELARVAAWGGGRPAAQPLEVD